jgi:hypothetical protein
MNALSRLFNTVVTRSKYPHECLIRVIALVARTVQAMHPDAITDNNANE